MGAIVVSRLGKAYKQYDSHWARLAEWLYPWRQRHRLKWVLQEITFDVRPGEAVGVIGINGAGKSTLLKLITGTTLPTMGSIQMSGRVAAMLELGMGFHPDFTGRQNAIMAGQLLGISTTELIRLMPEIEAFSEIGDYIDAPVRVYSSGMQMRLAFSVATVVRPDILIVDEALSVGDAYFQHKSFERIRTFRQQGTTLLIVSHDKAAIQSICDRALLLDSGQLLLQGAPEAVMDYYNAMLADRENQGVLQRLDSTGKTQTISGSGEAVIEAIHLLDVHGQAIEMVRAGQAIRLQVDAVIRRDVADLVLGFMIKDRLGQPVFGTNSHHMKKALKGLKAGQSMTFTIDLQAELGVGTYSVAVALHAGENHVAKNFEWRDMALVFNVVNTDKAEFVGVTWLPHQMDIRISTHE